VVAVFVTTLLLGADKTTIALESFFNSNTDLTPNPFPAREGEPTSKPLSFRTYAIAPLAPQIWGELDLLPPRLGGRGGKTMVFA